jgi:antitoxin (DNA-binding transcriptional repressor) of toxin-antitoxin stability system
MSSGEASMTSHPRPQTIQVSIDDIARDVRTYIQRVEAGVTVVIISAGHPIAELKPLDTIMPTQRPFGLAAGAFAVPDDFDAPLPDSVLNDFESI